MISKPNRLKKKQAKKGYSYCGCDRALVRSGAKCWYCGNWNGHKRFKKYSPMI